jgi:hypothetical protein
MVVVYPYLAKIGRVPGWEAFIKHNRSLVRGLLISFGLPLGMIGLSHFSGHIFSGAQGRFVFNAFGIVWVAYTAYFTISNTRQSSNLLCPRCGEHFSNKLRWRYDRCQNCALDVWSPISSREPGIDTRH